MFSPKAPEGVRLMLWIGLLVGFIAGGVFGVLMMGLLTASRERDEKMANTDRPKS
jgi:hypothetical protein